MNKELNAKLKTGLLKSLSEYLPQCKDSLVRNKHMHEFREVDSFEPAELRDGIELWLSSFIANFADTYDGEDRLGDVANALCDQAKALTGYPSKPSTRNEALLVDFLNHWASARCMDLGLYARDLRKPEVKQQQQQQPSPHMQQIELYTGMFEYVATVEIPPFDKNPEVVLWGVRHFRALGRPVINELERVPGATRDKPTAYVECFAYASMTESPGLPRWEPPTPPPVDRGATDVVGKAAAPGVPDTTLQQDGQQAGYQVLSEAERAKGFVRPVRKSYIHVGRKICGKVAPATLVNFLEEGYVAWVCNLAPGHSPADGCAYKAVTEHEYKTLKKTGTLTGCEYVTSMGQALAETYARDPEHYTGTFCSHCKMHFPVGKHGEFDWMGEEGNKVGT